MILPNNTRLQNRYLIVRLLGQGGFGAVYEARHLGLGHRVALKQLTLAGPQVLKGHLWEWVFDEYDSNYYNSSPSENPTGPSTDKNKVLRGGSWNFSMRDSRVRSRSKQGRCQFPLRVRRFSLRQLTVKGMVSPIRFTFRNPTPAS